MTGPASSPQEAGAPHLVEHIAAAMMDLTYRGEQLSSAHALKLSELAWPLVEAAMASREAEVRQKVAEEIDAFAERHKLAGFGSANYRTALRKAAEIARGAS